MTNLKEAQKEIEYEEADLQCLEACAGRGLTIEDWILIKTTILNCNKQAVAQLNKGNR